MHEKINDLYSDSSNARSSELQQLKNWLQANKRYGWIPLILILMSFQKTRKVKTMRVTNIYSYGFRVENISSYRQLTVNDTIRVVNKSSIETYVFICNGEMYATPVLINTRNVRVGDTIHIIK